jgi:integrase
MSRLGEDLQKLKACCRPRRGRTMIRTSERRKKRRKARRTRSRCAPAAVPREPTARCFLSPEPGPRTSSAQLALADQRPTETASTSWIETRDDGARLPSLAHGLRAPILEVQPDDVARPRATLPPSHHAEVFDLARVFRISESAATTTTTRALYLHRFTLFASWCAARGARAMPAEPEVLRLYLVSLADERKALSTLDVSVAAITMAHRALGHDPPASDELRLTLRSLRLTLRSLRQTLGSDRPRPAPISLTLLRQIVAPCERDPHGIRDRALLLVTYFASLRRTETAGLNREAVHREERGYRLLLDNARRDPTDAPPLLTSHAEQNLCPVLALSAWLDARALRARGGDLSATHGPVFVALRRGGPHRVHLGDRLALTDVDRIVKRRAVAAGLNPAGLSAASLRAGFAAEAARGGTSSAA